MTTIPHTLEEEFPDQIEAIRALKGQNERFAALLAEYDDVNEQIHKAETLIAPVSQDTETALRKRRLALKDVIAVAVSAA